MSASGTGFHLSTQLIDALIESYGLYETKTAARCGTAAL